MSRRHDPAHDYDGGWVDGVETGEGLEEHLLGPVDPHDRGDYFTPDRRFATRPGMRWIKEEHATDWLASDLRGNAIGARIDPAVAKALGRQFSGPGVRGSRPQAGREEAAVADRNRSEVAQARRPARPDGLPENSRRRRKASPTPGSDSRPIDAPFRRQSRQQEAERLKAEAQRLGISVQELRRRQREGAAAKVQRAERNKTKGAAGQGGQPTKTEVKKQRRAKRSFTVQAAKAREARALADRLAATSGPRPDAPPLPKKPLRSSEPDTQPGICPSCSGPIRANGACGCT